MKELAQLVRDFMRWLFPNGMGTRAALAFIIVGVAVTQLTAGDAKEALLIVLAFYFMDKANGNANGGGAAGGGQ